MLAQKTTELSELFPQETRQKWETKEIVKAIHRSQHAQRNYDRSKSIPIEDLKTIITSATQCPSKQNVAFYNLHVITNREVIDQVYETTTNKMLPEENRKGYEHLSNPQILGNVLLVFEQKPQGQLVAPDRGGLKESVELWERAAKDEADNKRIIEQNAQIAVGLAAGYVNLTASLLGYETGCCCCVMDYDKLQSILGLEGFPLLLMGVGFGNEGINRKVHQLYGTQDWKDNNWLESFKSRKKQPIKISYYK